MSFTCRQLIAWKYVVRSASTIGRAVRRLCPNCGYGEFDVVKLKHLVTALARCHSCKILYRIPTDPPRFNENFYQSAYSSGFTTELPSPDVLESLKRRSFRGTGKNFDGRIELLRALGVKTGQRLLDFGSSWGYGVWQLEKAGFDVAGVEISASRARYAREALGVDVVDDIDLIEGPFDAVFACHVLEHIPQPAEVFDWAASILKPGGLLVMITPNGSTERAGVDPVGYHRNWGQVHPVYLNKEFYEAAFRGRAKLLAAAPYDLKAIAAWDREGSVSLDLSGWELLCAVRGVER